MDSNNAFSEFERKGWNSTADVYDSHFGRHTVKYAAPLLDLAEVRQGSKVLDLACGPGYLSAAANDRGAQILGIDFASNMVAVAKSKFPTLTFQSDNAENLSLADRSFDAVVMGFGMLHLAHPEAAAAESCRVVKPGGRFAFSVWGNPEKVCLGTGILNRAMQDHANMALGLPDGPPVFRFADHAESERLLSGAGFIDIHIKQVDQAWVLRKASDLLDTFREGGVRAGEILRAQNAATLDTIREQVIRDAEVFRKGNMFEIPMGAVIASGKKPG